MEEVISNLVEMINVREGKEAIQFFKLNDNSWLIKEISDTREPKMSSFVTVESCYKYLERLITDKYGIVNSILIGGKTEKSIEGSLFEVWYDGGYLGLYRSESFEGACIRALEEIGVSEENIEKEISAGDRLFSSELSMKYAEVMRNY